MKRRHHHCNKCSNLLDISPGHRVCIESLDGLKEARREHLMAFGLTEGQWVEILQHRPATVIQIDYTELALEHKDARRILVSNPVFTRGFRHRKRHADRREKRHRRGFLRRHRSKAHKRFFSRVFGKEKEEHG